MAIYHLEAKIISRGTGRSVVAASAYKQRKYWLKETIHRDGEVFSRYDSSKYITGEPGAGKLHAGFYRGRAL